MELKGKKVNFIGDSITEGIGTSFEDKIYLNCLKRQAGLVCARNYGISATRIAAQKNRNMLSDEQNFCNRIQKMEDDADVGWYLAGQMILAMEMLRLDFLRIVRNGHFMVHVI